jgi:RNA polymerase sigma-B factor
VEANDTIAALRLYHETGDLALRDRIVEQHMALVRHLAKRFVRQAGSIDDLVQAGSIALLRAIDGFDPDLGFRFSTYAASAIIGELKRYLRDKGWAVRPPRRLQELYLEIGQVTAELTQRLGRSPTVAELAREVGASESDVLEAMEAGQGYSATSLDVAVDNSTSGEAQSRPELGMEDRELGTSETRMLLAQCLNQLSEQDRRIVELRFFEDLTQAEIGSRLGISQMHVSRRLAGTLVRMRQLLSSGEQP